MPILINPPALCENINLRHSPPRSPAHTHSRPMMWGDHSTVGTYPLHTFQGYDAGKRLYGHITTISWQNILWASHVYNCLWRIVRQKQDQYSVKLAPFKSGLSLFSMFTALQIIKEKSVHYVLQLLLVWSVDVLFLQTQVVLWTRKYPLNFLTLN